MIELAYLLALSLPTPYLGCLNAKVWPLLHIDILTLLPSELAREVLQWLDWRDMVRCQVRRGAPKWTSRTDGLTHLCRKLVCKSWHDLIREDQIVWKRLYVNQGWSFDKEAVEFWMQLGSEEPDLFVGDGQRSARSSGKGSGPSLHRGMDEGMGEDEGVYSELEHLPSLQIEEDSMEIDGRSSPPRPGPSSSPSELRLRLPRSSPMALNAGSYGDISIHPGLPPSPRHFNHPALPPSPSATDIDMAAATSSATLPRGAPLYLDHKGSAMLMGDDIPPTHQLEAELPHSWTAAVGPGPVRHHPSSVPTTPSKSMVISRPRTLKMADGPGRTSPHTRSTFPGHDVGRPKRFSFPNSFPVTDASGDERFLSRDLGTPPLGSDVRSPSRRSDSFPITIEKVSGVHYDPLTGCPMVNWRCACQVQTSDFLSSLTRSLTPLRRHVRSPHAD